MDENKKSSVSIRWGSVILIVAIVFILFKIDIKDKIQSEQFQENISYIKEQAQNIWNKIVDITKSKASEVIINSANEGLDKIQNDIKKNINTDSLKK